MLIVGKLEKIAKNPVEVLEQSIRKGWLDVFPVRDDGASLSRGRPPAEPKGFAAIREWEEMQGGGQEKEVRKA